MTAHEGGSERNKGAPGSANAPVVSEVADWADTDTPTAQGHRRGALLLPLGVVGLIAMTFAVRGRWTAAVVAVVLILGITVARAVSPAFERRFTTGLAWFGRAVGHLLRWTLLGAMFLLVIMPVSAMQALRRGESLGRPRGAGDGWVGRTAMGPIGPVARGFGVEPTVTVRSPLVVRGLALLALLLVFDLLAGALLTGAGLLRPFDRGDVADLEQQRPDLNDIPPAWEGEPWAGELMDSLIRYQTDRYVSTPYVQFEGYPFHSRYLNTTEYERLSYQPPVAAGQRPLEVAFLGGSVMFGIGQRDDHTIPSEFARLAEAHGIPVQVHNFGLPRWALWQEWQYLERRLAAGEHFDLVVFLDGFNEFLVQAEQPSNDPTHHAAAALDEIVSAYDQQRAEPPTAVDGLSELVSSYERASGLWRMIDLLRGRHVPYPGAGQASTDEAALVDDAMDVYLRGISLTFDLGEEYQTPVSFFWQPRQAGWSRDILDRLPPFVHDVSSAFDGEESQPYFDPVHTNEKGARLIAEAMWAQVGDQLATTP